MKRAIIITCFFLFVSTLFPGCDVANTGRKAPAMIEPVTVFEPVSGVYSSMRIPALVASKKGTLLAFAAGRIESGSDWADMDLVLKRSEDGGRTWGALQVVAARNGGKPTDNPAPIVGRDGTIHLLYQRDYARAYYTSSSDDGLTWREPVDITSAFEAFKSEYNWKVLAPGPGHGIQLKNGRLVVPVWLADSDKLEPQRSHRPSRVATIYSDDNGKTWQRGALVPEAEGFKNPSETMAVQLKDGRVMLNIRNESAIHRRGVSYSPDGISEWTLPVYMDELFEPVCMGSLLRVQHKKKDYLLFVNPDSKDIPNHPRQNLTLKLSKDGGKSWPVKKVLHPGYAGYSDLAVMPGGTINCLFETRADNEKGLKLVLKQSSLDELLAD